MPLYLLCLAIVLGLPWSAFARTIDKGDTVEVKKGTQLCPHSELDAGHFWKVTSHVRLNHTQTVATFTHEKTYDAQSGDTRTEERLSQKSFAVFFKRDPQHAGLLLMVSPENGRVEAIVEDCGKKKN
jgi:hypothetical protein